MNKFLGLGLRAFCVSIVILALPARAALIDLDINGDSRNDGFTLSNADYSLEWMDLQLTMTMAVADIDNLLGQDWRVAKQYEVESLFSLLHESQPFDRTLLNYRHNSYRSRGNIQYTCRPNTGCVQGVDAMFSSGDYEQDFRTSSGRMADTKALVADDIGSHDYASNLSYFTSYYGVDNADFEDVGGVHTLSMSIQQQLYWSDRSDEQLQAFDYMLKLRSEDVDAGLYLVRDRVTPVPEPSSLALLLLVFSGLAVRKRFQGRMD